MPREKTQATTKAAPRKRAPRKTQEIRTAEPSYLQFVDPEKRAALIAEAAYFRAERRGFAPGNECADWLAAETEVDAKLLAESSATRV